MVENVRIDIGKRIEEKMIVKIHNYKGGIKLRDKNNDPIHFSILELYSKDKMVEI